MCSVRSETEKGYRIEVANFDHQCMIVHRISTPGRDLYYMASKLQTSTIGLDQCTLKVYDAELLANTHPFDCGNKDLDEF